MELISSAFQHMGEIPTKYACDGDKISPPLSFVDVPAGTKSLVLIMEDPDVPRTLRPDGMFDHWTVWNIPPTTKEVAENQAPAGVEGQNTRGTLGYIPPCPPDREHRYFFKLFALDKALNLPKMSSKKELLNAMNGLIIESAELIGRYLRQNG